MATINDFASRPKSASFRGKVAIVTGAGFHGEGVGGGRATAILLAEQACTVICVDQDIQTATKTTEIIEKEGSGKALAIQGDVTVSEDCEHIIKTCTEKYGRLDILVNIVGIGGAKGTAIDVGMAECAVALEVNITSMMLMCQFAIPAMLRNAGPARGSIVNMASMAGLNGGVSHLLYPTAEGTVANMTRAMAAHHARDGIRVNYVCPVMHYTPVMCGGGLSEEAREARRRPSLLGPDDTGWEAGCAARFLAGEEARWVTGVVLPVVAGMAAVGMELPKSAGVPS